MKNILLFSVVFFINNLLTAQQKVGINTSTPNATLDINGDLKIRSLSQAFISTNENKYLMVGSDSSIRKTESHWLDVSDAIGNFNRGLYRKGSLGIGIKDAVKMTGKMTISDSVHISDGRNGVFLDINNKAINFNSMSGIRFYKGAATIFEPDIINAGIFYISNPALGSGDLIFALRQGSNPFNTVSALDNEKMTIKAGGDVIIHEGDLGIGNLISVPQYPIHVNTDIKSYGGFFQNERSGSINRGIYTISENDGGSARGLFATARGSSTSSKIGVWGSSSTSGAAISYGLYGTYSNSDMATSRYAGYFSGDVFATGSYLPSFNALKTKVRPSQVVLNKLLNIKISEYQYKVEELPHMWSNPL